MRVFVTRRLPEEAVRIIREAADVDMWEDENPPSRSTLEERIAEADGLLCLLTDRIDGSLLDGAPKLKVVSQMAVGFDNIDVPACTARSIKVGNTPGVLTETTADLAYALLLAAARRVVEAERELREGKWQTWRPLQWTGLDVHHSTLGIVGMGRIGFEMARRAHGFEQTILYTGRRRNEEAESQFGAQFVQMHTLLEHSDFVTLHTPLNSETRHLFGKAQFERMKSTAILINTARGAVVNQSELVDALEIGIIAGAGLDVFEIEPLPLEDPLLTLPNVVLIPHIGSASTATRTKMAVLAARNVVAGIRGELLPHGLN